MCPIYYERENVHSTVGPGPRATREAEHEAQAEPPLALRTSRPILRNRILYCITRDAKLSELELRVEGRQEITAIHNGDFHTP